MAGTRDCAAAGDAKLPLAWIVAALAAATTGLVLRAAQLSIYDISYSDELMQYLEQANRMVTGSGIVPWEWRLGLRNALIPHLLAPPLAFGHALAPASLAGVWLARILFAGLTLLAFPAAWRLGALSGRAEALLGLFAVAVWWESILFSDLLLSESLAAALMLAGAAPLLDGRSSARRLGGAGLLVGLAVLVRLQFAVFAAVLVLGALRADLGRWKPFLAGGMAALGIAALSDAAAGLTPLSWIWVNIHSNIGDGRAARFGTSDPFDYLVMLRQHLWPVLPLIAVGAVAAGRRYGALLWAALANIVVHSAIGHKEYRFIWISVLTLLLLAGIGSGRLARYLAERRARPVGSMATLMVLAWTAMSAWSAHLTGGVAAYRGGGAVPRLVNLAVTKPQVCAVGVDYANKSHIVPALLQRPTELMLIPADVSSGMQPWPTGLIAAANALVLEGSPPRASGYQRLACDFLGQGQVCLFVRPGNCAPGPAWQYQREIEDNDL